MSMRTPLVPLCCLIFLALAVPAPLATAPNTAPTLLLRTPTVSATQIAFAYANNIWIVERAGGIAHRALGAAERLGDLALPLAELAPLVEPGGRLLVLGGRATPGGPFEAAGEGLPGGVRLFRRLPDVPRGT